MYYNCTTFSTLYLLYYSIYWFKKCSHSFCRLTFWSFIIICLQYDVERIQFFLTAGEKFLRISIECLFSVQTSLCAAGIHFKLLMEIFEDDVEAEKECLRMKLEITPWGQLLQRRLFLPRLSESYT